MAVVAWASGGQAAPSPPQTGARYAASRFVQMGFQSTSQQSNGTDTDSNSRTAFFNESGATLTNVKLLLPWWYATLTGEAVNADPGTLECAIEYPAGTFTRVTKGGSNIIAMSASTPNLLSDEITLATPIPPDAQAWVRVYVTAASGAKWPQGIASATNLGEAKDFSTGVNKVLGGTITNVSSTSGKHGYAPLGVVATGWTGTMRSKAVAVIGDSIAAGGNLSRLDAKGNQGLFGYGLTGTFPFFNAAISATLAKDNLSRPLLMEALSLMGVTDVMVEYGANDLQANPARSASTIYNDLGTIMSAVTAAGLRAHDTTKTPYTSSTDFWLTAAGQAKQGPNPTLPPSGQYDGANPVLNQLNDLIRAGRAGRAGLLELADAAMTARNSGIWKDYTSDTARMPAPSSQTVQSGPTTTTIPTGVTMIANQYATGFVRFTSGALNGTVAQVLSNTTAGVLTLSAALASAPAAGDTFQLFYTHSRMTLDGLHPNVSNSQIALPPLGGQAVLGAFVNTYVTGG